MFQIKNITLLLLIGLGISLYAQQPGVKLICSPRKDSILLRWAPSNAETWRLGNQYGYVVRRFTILQDSKMKKDFPSVILGTGVFKPANLEVWEAKAGNDKYIPIAAECIYGTYHGEETAQKNLQQVFNKYKEENHRFSFALYAADQSLDAAMLSGLYFADKTAKQDEKYLYRVYINCPDSLAVDTAYYFTGISEYQPLPKPIDFKADWSDKKVDLSWNIFYLKHIYNSYILEKSTDGGNTYFRINDNAIVQVSDEGIDPRFAYKTDTLPDNNTTVFYRLRGISTFGETGPPSDSLFGKGALMLDKAPVIVDNYVVENKRVHLSWEFPQELEPAISGFKIYRSQKPKGRKKIVYEGLEPEAREFIDESPYITNYYLISAYSDEKENISPILTYSQLVDSFPPNKPVRLSGKIDTTGQVLLSWFPNTDNDIDGYRVYRANNPNFEFQLVSPDLIQDTVFIDSINIKTLTKQVYYKLKAVDLHENQSEFSDLLALNRPDIIPPVAPVIKNLQNKNNIPEITWINSPSSDVVSHQLFRKELQDSTFHKIATFKSSDSTITFLDKEIKPGREYIYQVVAEDISGLVSAASNTGYFYIPSEKQESIKLKKKVLLDKVKLTWDIKTEKTVERILVYRSIGNEPMRVYGNSEDDEFVDDKLSPEKTYNYMVQAIYAGGTSSVYSNTVKVKM
jgi:fibronectin type 3 domain-containing protein